MRFLINDRNKIAINHPICRSDCFLIIREIVFPQLPSLIEYYVHVLIGGKITVFVSEFRHFKGRVEINIQYMFHFELYNLIRYEICILVLAYCICKFHYFIRSTNCSARETFPTKRRISFEAFLHRLNTIYKSCKIRIYDSNKIL